MPTRAHVCGMDPGRFREACGSGKAAGRGGLEEERAPAAQLFLRGSGGESSLACPAGPPHRRHPFRSQGRPVVDRGPTTRPPVLWLLRGVQHPAVPGARLRRRAGRPDVHRRLPRAGPAPSEHRCARPACWRPRPSRGLRGPSVLAPRGTGGSWAGLCVLDQECARKCGLWRPCPQLSPASCVLVSSSEDPRWEPHVPRGQQVFCESWGAAWGPSSRAGRQVRLGPLWYSLGSELQP